jgi:hypothetical protein
LIFASAVIGLIACHSDVKRELAEREIDSIMLDFSVRWKGDSLGQTGFRKDHHLQILLQRRD